MEPETVTRPLILKAWIAIGVALALTGCRVLEALGGITQGRLESAEMRPYLEAAKISKRAALGFTALPESGPVDVEIPRFKRHYDVMLHIYRDRVSRTVSYLLHDGRPIWSGEQEIHRSGREYDTADGRQGEQLVIAYSSVAGTGVPMGGYVSYFGPDAQLSGHDRLSVAEAKAIWERWDQEAMQ